MPAQWRRVPCLSRRAAWHGLAFRWQAGPVHVRVNSSAYGLSRGDRRYPDQVRPRVVVLGNSRQAEHGAVLPHGDRVHIVRPLAI